MWTVGCGGAWRRNEREGERDAGAGRAGVNGTGRRYEPVLQVAEIMLTLVTVNDPPLLVVVVVVEELVDGDEDELLGDVDVVDDDDELSVEPEKRPVIIT